MSNKRIIRAAMARAHTWPETLTAVPFEEWPPRRPPHVDLYPTRFLRSRFFMAQVYQEKRDVLRLSIHRTMVTSLRANGDPNFKGDITWDELMQVKREAGYADLWALECYPPDADVVNVANLRHLFLVEEPPSFGWRKGVPR